MSYTSTPFSALGKEDHGLASHRSAVALAGSASRHGNSGRKDVPTLPTNDSILAINAVELSSAMPRESRQGVGW
jgi:hypothetical protein